MVDSDRRHPMSNGGYLHVQKFYKIKGGDAYKIAEISIFSFQHGKNRQLY